MKPFTIISEDTICSNNVLQERSPNESRPTQSTSNIEKHYLLYCYIRIFIVLMYSGERATNTLTKTLKKIAIRLRIKIVTKIIIISKMSCQSKSETSRSRHDRTTPIHSERDHGAIPPTISTNQNPASKV